MHAVHPRPRLPYEQGFKLHRPPTQMAESGIYSRRALINTYLPEREAFVKKATGATRVIAAKYLVQNRSRPGEAPGYVVNRPHVDCTLVSGPKNFLNQLAETPETDDLEFKILQTHITQKPVLRVEVLFLRRTDISWSMCGGVGMGGVHCPLPSAAAGHSTMTGIWWKLVWCTRNARQRATRCARLARSSVFGFVTW